MGVRLFVQNPIYFALFALIGLLPFVPSFTSVVSLAFVLVYVVFVCHVVLRKSRGVKLDFMGVSVLVFCFFFLPVFTLVSILMGNAVEEVIRASVPFYFIVTYVFFLQDAEHFAENASKYIVVSGLAWAGGVLLKYPSEFFSALTGGIARLTYVSSELLVPLGMVSIVVLLYEKRMGVVLRLVLVACLSLLVLVSGYRSQMALIVMAVLFSQRNIFKFRSFVFLFLFAFSGALFLYLSPHYLDLMMSRFQYSAGDDVRASEIAYASHVFSLSNVFGGGFGTQVPLALTRPESVLVNFDSSYVSYIHNFFWYVLMTSGVFGVFFFSLVLLPMVVSVFRRLVVIRNFRDVEGAVVCLVVIFTYFQVSASFRQIQMWVIICLLAVVVNYSVSPRWLRR